MEEGIEEMQILGVEFNYDNNDLDSIIDTLMSSTHIPDDIKRKLVFL